MTVGKLAHATVTWWQAHFGAVMLGSLHLSCSSSDKPKKGEELKNFSWENDPVEVQKSKFDGVKGAVCTTQKVTIPPFHTVNIKANASVKGHCMKVHVLMEPVLSPQLPASVVPIATYGEPHPGSSRVPVCLCKLGTHAVKIPPKLWLVRLSLPTKYHQWSTWPGPLQRQLLKYPKDGSWRL